MFLSKTSTKLKN